MISIVRTAVFLGVALALGACGGLSNTFGLDKSAPDEYQVVQHAPLAMPPEFALRPPSPGAARPQERATREEAKRLLTGTEAAAGRPTQTPGEAALLHLAGPSDPDIRRQINAESSFLAEEDVGFVQNLMFWQDNDPAGTIVDPVAEAQRLQRNAEAGLPVNEGETPVIRRRIKAPLEDFNPF